MYVLINLFVEKLLITAMDMKIDSRYGKGLVPPAYYIISNIRYLLIRGAIQKKLTFLADMSAKAGGAGRQNPRKGKMKKKKQQYLNMYMKKKTYIFFSFYPLRPRGGGLKF